MKILLAASSSMKKNKNNSIYTCGNHGTDVKILWSTLFSHIFEKETLLFIEITIKSICHLPTTVECNPAFFLAASTGRSLEIILMMMTTTTIVWNTFSFFFFQCILVKFVTLLDFDPLFIKIKKRSQWPRKL